MKKILLISFLSFCFAGVYGQVEMILPYNHPARSVDNITHIADKDGNVYLLSYVEYFYPGPGVLIDGSPPYGISILKIDNNNAVNWENFSDTAASGSSTLPVPWGTMYASQLFLQNGNIIVPYSFDMNYRTCVAEPNDEGITSRNGILALDNNGAPIINQVFDQDTDCGQYTLLYTAQYQSGNLAYIYRNEKKQHCYISQLSSSFTNVSLTVADSLSNIYSNTIFDPSVDNLVACLLDSFMVYDSAGNPLRSVQLPHSYPSSRLVPLTMACNDKYYAVSYWEDSIDHDFLAIYTKDGTLVSAVPSRNFQKLIMTPDDHIWGIAWPGYLDSTMLTPLTFMQMDLFGNVIRQKSVGKPFVSGNAISINNGNVIITGTAGTSSPDNNPKTPDRLYFYREAIADIPLIPVSGDQCNGISIFPNPARNTIHIVSNSYNITHGATITLCNTLGQHLGTYNWNIKGIDIDISTLPQGVYYIRADNADSKNICIQKMVKL